MVKAWELGDKERMEGERNKEGERGRREERVAERAEGGGSNRRGKRR